MNNELFKVIPNSLNKGFGFCVYGELTEKHYEMIKSCNLVIEKTDKYTNVFPTQESDFTPLFEVNNFKYMDGFSPNLNKNLHIGHFSNLVLAKSFQALGVADKYISILGDTLDGDVSKDTALADFNTYCKDFGYKVDEIYFASEMICPEDIFVDGVGDYENTKVIEVGDDKLVAIKKDGTTSYFYQDIALAHKLNAKTLYLTGYEQSNHFATLKKIFPHIEHMGLGLVKVKNGKMSSRLGNVIYMKDFMSELMNEFDNNEQLCYNIFAGYILKANPTSDKVFHVDTMKNPKTSLGLYLSYTMARLKSAGVSIVDKDDFKTLQLQYLHLKSKATLNPTFLFNGLVDLCKQINQLYITHHISGNEYNKKMFEGYLAELNLGFKKLGLFEISKV